ncbi:class I SAM-dependent methyltransferase [Orrella sp. 11846]|uniref:class I SAM-dependent methyltransferase n=1 Tax=Orrella sp. 11846 TaxID=3409913 RepID=UPI003B5BE949
MSEMSSESTPSASLMNRLQTIQTDQTTQANEIVDRGYQVRFKDVAIPGASSVRLKTLLDRQQYWDPDGQAARLGISEALWPLFGMLWPGSIHLASRVAQRPVCDKETILEIGCGLALASLVAHSQGANVTASDCHPLASRFLSANMHLNDLPSGLRYRHGQWGLDVSKQFVPDGIKPLSDARFDLVIASDVLYERGMADDVAAFIDRHANQQAQAWVVDANRGYRTALNRSMETYGFHLVDDERLDDIETNGKTRPFKGRFLQYQRA